MAQLDSTEPRKDATVTYKKEEVLEIQRRMCVWGAGLGSEMLKDVWDTWMYAHQHVHTHTPFCKAE